MKLIAYALAGVAASACIAVAATALADKPAIGAWGFDLSGMDRSVKPGDDFFDYANGAWFKRTEIPADRSSVGSFQDLRVLSEERMKTLVNALEARDAASLSPEEKQIRDLYDAYMDRAGIEAHGLAPAKADLGRIAAAATLDDIAALMGDRALPTSAIVNDGVGIDGKNSKAYVVTASQAGLGMPTRDYYLKDDPKLAEARDAYKAYLAQMLTLSGASDATARAAAVYAVEDAIAQAQWAPAENRNADKTYNPMTITELQAFAPGFNWIAFFKVQGIDAGRKVIVRQNTAFPKLAEIFAKTPVAVWKDYLTVHYLHNVAEYLPKAFEDTDFAFYGKKIDGASVPLPYATRAAHLIDDTLPDPFGKIYAAKYFPPATKAKADALVANIIAAYDADIRKIDWMSDVTKRRALDKLHAFTPHIGYPDHWRDFSGLVVKTDDLIGDVERANVFEWQYRLGRIDGAVVRDEWNMTPPTVNAYYTQSLNSIFFPAAILQPPFFDPNADDAVNYGGIGVVIGHEIGHGFDDQGSKYTGEGNLESWWTAEDRAAFETRVKALGDQYSSYEGLPGLHLNGMLTMGENIGDLSGVAIALQAYHVSLHGKKAPVLDGFTGDQRFYLGFAQVWRGKYRDEAMRQQVLGNPHSPPHFRAVGPTRNVDPWYAAFDVKPGDKMYLPPDQRVKLW
ncbi:MAG TPA: M13-type metalloendopeptidase [Rhizomicrobium sp.]|jgi:putative endopeptidase|nr:M13-type metalloendopeptidase [Rhizomicrobium sp.]